ncbi:MAG: 16S rRNA (cytosine(967)-C(5))-methyltransferase RsmB, partial [Clostridium celatum]|nr:16S rRNA (cytosine(967)-C(5))-methyltransferase RsmB [Clostridium celatum]
GYACPEAIIIKGGSSIENNELFREGYITVQDESAMLVAPLLDINEGDVVLDLCSAPGGKTTHAAELLEGTGKVYAFDLHENKLSLITENVERLGLNNVEVDAMDATKLNSKYVSMADKVLIDVPCSGLGIIRKKPEIKWNKSRKSLKDLVPTQREIMENAWQYLKQGGTMIYSTCTLNNEENGENVEWFLNKHKDAVIEKIFLGNMDNFIYEKNGALTILPNEYMDGFYIAKISKK